MPRIIVALLAFALAAGACGGDEAPPEEVVASALEQTASAQSFRVSVATGQTISSSALGVDDATTPDADRPAVVGEVVDGNAHYVVALGPVLGPTMTDPAAAAAVEDVRFELWTDQDRVIVDTTGYGAIAELNPAADFGPFAPGLSYVDLTRAADDAQATDLLGLAGAAAVPDLQELATALPAALVAVERDPDDPDAFTGTGSLAEVLTAMGTDVEDAARSFAAGLALNVPVDPSELAAFYSGFYAQKRADVRVVLAEDGSVGSVAVRSDISDVFDALFADEALFPDLSNADRNEAIDAFADTVWVIETLTSFEPDESLVFEPPSGELEDRTDEWLELLSSVS